MKEKDFSIKQILEAIPIEDSDHRDWRKGKLHASDFGKCPSGIYHALMGEEPDTPIDQKSLRRMSLGNMVEDAQVKKLKSLGVFIEPEVGLQHKVYNEKYNVSGNIDAIVISPEECTKEAKDIIKRKKEINKKLSEYRGNTYTGIKKLKAGEISKEEYFEGKNKLMRMENDLYKDLHAMNQVLLKPDPKNKLIILEIKSTNEWGFKYYLKESKANDNHERQALFYLSEKRKKYPKISARVLYVGVPFQELLEFNIPYSTKKVEELQEFWTMLNKAVKAQKQPEPALDLIQSDLNGKWKVNYQAEWCRFHIRCTGDPNWLAKAKTKVTSLNLRSKPTRKTTKKVEKKTIKKKTNAKK